MSSITHAMRGWIDILDGQFDECSLTLSEIHAIEDSLTKSLIGIYHGRIKYPEQRTA